MGHKVWLEEFAKSEYAEEINNKPEKFCGLKFQMLNPKVCIKIYNSGKMRLTGAKRKEDIEEAF